MNRQTTFKDRLYIKVREHIKGKRVGFLLGAGSSFLDGTGYPLAAGLWPAIKTRTTDGDQRLIEAQIAAGSSTLEQALDAIDHGRGEDFALRHRVTRSIAAAFLDHRPPLDCHRQFVARLTKRREKRIPVFTLNYDPLMELAADREQVSLADGFCGIVESPFQPYCFDDFRGTIESRRGRPVHVPIRGIINLYKLHGSLGWFVDDESRLVRIRPDIPCPPGWRHLMVPPQNLTRRRNVFARHSWENNFYLQRIRQFANRSVIEVLRPGDPDSVADEADLVVKVVERVAVLCSVLYSSRASVQNRLAIAEHRKEVVDFIIGPGFKFLRSSTKKERGITGVTVDERFVRRFQRLGLEVLVEQATQPNELSVRLRQGLQWLLESRLEPSLGAAVVKTAIALESFLGANETEPLRRTLSERTAFLLSDTPDLRAKSSRVIRDFYDVRSSGTRRPWEGAWGESPASRGSRPPVSPISNYAGSEFRYFRFIRWGYEVGRGSTLGARFDDNATV